MAIIIKVYLFLQVDFWYVRKITKLAFQKKNQILPLRLQKYEVKKYKLYTKHYIANCNQIHNFNLNGRAKIFYGKTILII